MTTNPAPAQTTDPRTTLLQAVDQVLALVGLVTPADLDRPTPCDEYDVRHLLGHLLGGLGRVAHVAGGGLLVDVPSMVLDVADDGWVRACDEAAAGLRAAWADDAVLDRVLHPPFGDVPGRGAALAYVSELTTHAWDLASAVGRRDALDEGLAVVAADVARRFIPDAQRGVIPFGPVVPVADDAAPYDRLVAWVGRDPGWTPSA
ncbi:TIGR03086 family metal-binding protein [Kineosporia sp. A_224]|uniref:TIGR03086 family metal-binding protein n=1 Tax=Kineosporia sp. A_224 TaxID=1962180 RepID=UPI000B4B506A|nr:TIGR03086 family metal-binding protein [Kineosporia sp. A_224]